MTNKKSTKRALLLSALSLLLCVSMLVGSTFAWFTDSVTSGNNIIKSGNLDVELEYKKVVDGVATEWATVKDKTDIFDPNALWEPGRVEVVYLKVTNLGTLALKYQLGVNFKDITIGKTEDNKDIKLSDHLAFKTVEMPDALTTYTDREAVKLAAGTEQGLKDYNGKTTALEPKNADGTNNFEDYVALIVYMPETVGNEANYRGTDVPTIELGINLYATQYTAEEDSFDEFYDKNAWVKGFKVYDANELQGAINAGETNISLMNDIEVTEPVNVPAGATVALDMNGYDLSGSVKNLIYSQGNLTITGEGEITSTLKGYSYAIRAQKGTVLVDGNITVNSEFGCIEIYNGSNVTINNGSYNAVGVSPKTSHTVYVKDSTLTVNGGTFDSGYSSEGIDTICGSGTATIALKGGNFYASELGESFFLKGNVVVTGGAYQYNPGSRIATGYKAVKSNGLYYVIPENIDSVVSTAAELAAAITNGGTISVVADIDMANSWTSVKPTREMTILGNGNTITNLNLPLLAGNVSTKVTINGLTVADSTVAPAAVENGLGSAAFIPYVDAAGNVTLEDCHIKNSSVSATVRAGGMVGYSSGQSLTIKNCSVEGCNITGVEGAGGLVALSQSVNTFENCSVKNSKLTATEDRGGSTPVAGAVIGTVNGATTPTTLTNVTVSGNTVSNNNAKPVFNDCIGRWVAGELTIDNIPVVRNNDALKAAIEGGAKEILLAEGNYVITNNADGVTIKGVDKDKVVLNNNSGFAGNAGMNGAIKQRMNFENLTFENTVFTMTEGGNSTFTNVYFKEGFRHGYGTGVVFTNCSFGSNYENYALHFESDGESTNAIQLNGCKFEGGKIHLGVGRTYAFTDCEFAEGTDFQVFRTATATVKNCTVNGEKVTAANANTFFPLLDLSKVTFQ